MLLAVLTITTKTSSCPSSSYSQALELPRPIMLPSDVLEPVESKSTFGLCGFPLWPQNVIHCSHQVGKPSKKRVSPHPQAILSLLVNRRMMGDVMQAVLGPCLAEIGLYGNVSAYVLTIRSPWLVKRAYLLRVHFLSSQLTCSPMRSRPTTKNEMPWKRRK